MIKRMPSSHMTCRRCADVLWISMFLFMYVYRFLATGYFGVGICIMRMSYTRIIGIIIIIIIITIIIITTTITTISTAFGSISTD